MPEVNLVTKATNGTIAPEPIWEGVQYTPRVDIAETREELLLFCDIPGTKPGEIQLRFDQGELSLFAKVSSRQKDQPAWLSEYGVGDFYRSFSIAESIDANKIAADYKLGVLTVHLPKKESAKPRQIAITAS